MRGVVFDLHAREAQGGQAGEEVVVVALAIGGLRGRGAVVAEAVGFDDEVELGPVEVDAVAIDVGLGLRWGEACSFGDA